jgi:hypothetical protein
VLLRQSKEAANRDKKERGIEFNDYLEAVDHDVYTEDEEVNVDMDFAMLRPTKSNLLQATLAFLSIAINSLSLLRFPRNPRLFSAHFVPAALVKTWSKELVGIIAFTSFRSRDLMSCDNASH